MKFLSLHTLDEIVTLYVFVLVEYEVRVRIQVSIKELDRFKLGYNRISIYEVFISFIAFNVKRLTISFFPFILLG